MKKPKIVPKMLIVEVDDKPISFKIRKGTYTVETTANPLDGISFSVSLYRLQADRLRFLDNETQLFFVKKPGLPDGWPKKDGPIRWHFERDLSGNAIIIGRIRKIDSIRVYVSQRGAFLIDFYGNAFSTDDQRRAGDFGIPEEHMDDDDQPVRLSVRTALQAIHAFVDRHGSGKCKICQRNKIEGLS